MNKDQATKIVIDTMLNVDTTTTRGQLLLIGQFADTLANETERAFRAGLKRGKALAAEMVDDAKADAEAQANEDGLAGPGIDFVEVDPQA